MFLVDDIFMFPFKGLSWIVRQIQHAVEEEQALGAENITRELSELYMMLETGRITESEFDEREAELLDLLDEIQGRVDAGEDSPGMDWDETDGEADEPDPDDPK
ncbi:MAG: gas vesicle protein GvpG [Desulfobacterales bacterium]|nr:gas vesicle protein GvpG [Desulfobacterales bacterium]